MYPETGIEILRELRLLREAAESIAKSLASNPPYQEANNPPGGDWADVTVYGDDRRIYENLVTGEMRTEAFEDGDVAGSPSDGWKLNEQTDEESGLAKHIRTHPREVN